MTRLPCGCPDAFPDWDGQDINLGAWLVHEIGTPMFFHMPIGFEACLHKQHKDIEQLGLHPRWPGFVLARSAMFRGAILCPLQEERSPARNVRRLPNPFHVRASIIHGDVDNIRNAVSHIQSELLDQRRMPRELFLAYLTCPACKDERGGSKMLILRHWEESEKLRKRLRKR